MCQVKLNPFQSITQPAQWLKVHASLLLTRFIGCLITHKKLQWFNFAERVQIKMTYVSIMIVKNIFTYESGSMSFLYFLDFKPILDAWQIYILIYWVCL